MQGGGGGKGPPRVASQGKSVPVLAEGSVRGTVCKRIRTWGELGAWQRGWGWCGVQGGGVWAGTCTLREALKRGWGLWDVGRALAAPKVFVIYCPPPWDLSPFLLLFSLFFPPILFFVLIVPTVSSGRGMRWRMEAWEGASPLCATGVYMSAADVERVKRERERGWETVPPHSSPQPPPFPLFH